MADNAELLQRIELLESLITADYVAPEGPEYSFPVTGQGVTSSQYQQMMRAAGTGVFVGSDATGAQSPYRLVGMPGGDTETDAKNQMILKTSNVTGTSEAVISGYFHRQTQDMILDFPPVTTATTYYVCLVYDPVDESAESGPVSIRVLTNPTSTTGGKNFITLWTVHREPSQLLSQATITQTRQWVSPTITVFYKEHLPEPATVEYGTIAVVLNPGQARGANIYSCRGVLGWVPLLGGEWVERTLVNGWTRYSSAYPPVRLMRDGSRVHMSGMVRDGQSMSIMQTTEAFRPAYDQTYTVTTGAGGKTGRLIVGKDNWVRLINGFDTADWVSLDGITYYLD